MLAAIALAAALAVALATALLGMEDAIDGLVKWRPMPGEAKY